MSTRRIILGSVATLLATTTVATMFDLGHIEGDLAQLGTDGIAVENGTGPATVRLGDTLAVTFQTGTATFTVRAIYDHASESIGSRFVDLAAFEANLLDRLDSRIYANSEDVTVVEQAAAGYPTAKLLTTEAFITQQNGNLDTIIALFGAALGLTVGTFLAWTMVHAITTGGMARFVIPTGSLIIVAAIATIAGVTAALLPARRAARINILTAVTTV